MILINKQHRKRVRLSNEPTVHIMTDGTCEKYKMVKQFDTMKQRRKRVRLSNEPTVHIMTDGTCEKYKIQNGKTI